LEKHEITLWEIGFLPVLKVDPMHSFLLVFFLFFTSVCVAERNKSELQELPSFLEGIEVNGKILGHGYIRWLEKPFSPMINPAFSKEGEKIYVKHYLECHGPKGKGDGPIAQKYAVKAANLQKTSKTLTNHTLFIQVTMGKVDIPQRMDVLTEEETWALTHYLNNFK
jgi:hypothetical protein